MKIFHFDLNPLHNNKNHFLYDYIWSQYASLPGSHIF